MIKISKRKTKITLSILGVLLYILGLWVVFTYTTEAELLALGFWYLPLTILGLISCIVTVLGMLYLVVKFCDYIYKKIEWTK